MSHAFFVAAAQPAEEGAGAECFSLALAVAHVGASMQQFEPGVLFCGVGEFGVK